MKDLIHCAFIWQSNKACFRALIVNTSILIIQYRAMHPNASPQNWRPQGRGARVGMSVDDRAHTYSLKAMQKCQSSARSLMVREHSHTHGRNMRTSHMQGRRQE